MLSLKTAKLKTLYFVFTYSAEDLFTLTSKNSEWSIKKMGISTLIHVTGACNRTSLKMELLAINKRFSPFSLLLWPSL